MPSMTTGRTLSSLSFHSKLSNISSEILTEVPSLNDDQLIIILSPSINLTYKIILPILIFVGTCGSMMSLKCLYAQRFRKNNSTYIFFFFISLVDLAVLYTGALRLLILAFTGFDVRHTSLFICRIHRFTTYFLLELSSCLLTLMTLDRSRKTLSMLPPLNNSNMILRTTQLLTNDHHRTFNVNARQSKILWITLIVIFCLFILDSHFFYCTGYASHKESNQIVCQSVANNSHCRRYWLIYLWIDAFIYSYLPFFIIAVCNARLIIYLKQQRKRRLELTSSKIHLSHHHRMTFSIVLMSVLFLVLSVPVTFLEQFENRLSQYKYFYHFLAIAHLIMYFNHTVTFFLFLFGSQFRQSVKELIIAQAIERPRTNTTLSALVIHRQTAKNQFI